MMKKALILLLICLSNGWLFANHWTPNDSEYEDNMTLTGVIQINGVEQQLTTLEVGAFCGEECRGSGYPTYFFPTQRYVIQLLIFGEVGDQLTFKLYDSDSGLELNLTSPEAVSFVANGYGSLTDPYILNFTGSIGENYTVSVSANPEEGGTVQGAGTYLEGQTCTLVATANEGYAFSNWKENGTIVSTNPTYAFSVTSNRTIIANFTVTGSNTHWVPNESGYEDNMTLTGVIQINGVEQQSTTLEVGAFCGEECRGTSLATYFFPTQRYVVQLLIFGESGDQITFKLYDHAVGQELNLTSPEAIAFVANGYGSLGDPYVLNFTGQVPTSFHFTIPGNWSQPSNWQGGTLPGANDAAFIDAPCTLDVDAEVANLTITAGQSLTLQAGKILTVTNVLTNESPTALTIESGAQLIHSNAGVQATVKKTISGYGTGSDDWYLVACPLVEDVTPNIGNGFLSSDYDLYKYSPIDLDGLEWRNFKLEDFTLLGGNGYLYANGTGTELNIEGALVPSNSNVMKTVSYEVGNNSPGNGWTLLGNPFACNCYLVDVNGNPLTIYKMDADGTGLVEVLSGPIAPMEGFFYYTSETRNVYFSRTAPAGVGD